MELKVRKIENGWLINGLWADLEFYCKTPEEVLSKLKEIVRKWSPVDYGETWAHPKE